MRVQKEMKEQTKSQKGQATVLTRTGKKVGRPRSQHKIMGTIQTRAPARMLKYCQILRTLKFDSLMDMFEKMLREFDKEKPWEHGLKWRHPRSSKAQAKDEIRMTGWEPVNINIEASFKEEISNRCKVMGVSMATYCYTAIYWWVQYVYPPEKKN